ncbi:MAG: hypothetical protein KF823_14815 [Xanthomonadales bacterium]|nr:hypothetical protein [Xanthomonadales bacterium]
MRRPALALLLAAGLPVVQAMDVDLVVAGAELSLVAGERRLAGADLVGLDIDLPGLGTLRIDGARPDAQARFPGLWLYQARLRAPGRRRFQPFCTPDPEGETDVVFFQGTVDEAQRYLPDRDRFSLSCVSGVQAKCLRWGYEPWRTAPATGQPLQPHFEACMRAARADYCGDGESATRDGTLIDIYDRDGVQAPEQDAPGLAFEAGWRPDGATCVNHTRIAELLDVDTLQRHCPRLTGAEACDEATAQAQGAVLFVRSRAGNPPSAD